MHSSSTMGWLTHGRQDGITLGRQDGTGWLTHGRQDWTGRLTHGRQDGTEWLTTVECVNYLVKIAARQPLLT